MLVGTQVVEKKLTARFVFNLAIWQIDKAMAQVWHIRRCDVE